LEALVHRRDKALILRVLYQLDTILLTCLLTILPKLWLGGCVINEINCTHPRIRVGQDGLDAPLGESTITINRNNNIDEVSSHGFSGARLNSLWSKIDRLTARNSPKGFPLGEEHSVSAAR
jgi:hypothetical protein